MVKESTLKIPAFETLDVDDFDPLGIDADEIHLIERTKRNISLLIHQTWKHGALPAIVENWTKSWSINHPPRCLIADRHKSLLRIFDEYSENIRRADALRYMVLYEFGGIYADIDFESLRSLHVLVRSYSCILAQDPYEQYIIAGNYEHLVSNAFIASCVSLKTFGIIRKPYIFSFTLHHWNHTYYENGVTLESTRDICDVIPGAGMYDCIKGIISNNDIYITE
ncbi:hypothetical protein ACJMK2_006506 [Sinanodonta woodiana]|uniref:Uncharacterized protein n=1 Tax=Sinanodonta woodiana TaxID=1069815 RepID=A0ABD3VTS7_SINWO